MKYILMTMQIVIILSLLGCDFNKIKPVQNDASDADISRAIINPGYSINISAGGTGSRMRVGDIDGDGVYELVLGQPNSGINDAYIPHEINMITAFKLNGTKLWQVGTTNNISSSGSDEPIQIHDIDNDGRNEVVDVRGDKFEIRNGNTGAVEKSYSLPNSNAHDCIVFANLFGTPNGPAQDVILKDRYNNAWAFDKNFTQKWKVTAGVGHYPWPYDIDGDGLDEIAMGWSMYESNGSRKWTYSHSDHPDCIWFGDVNGDGNMDVVYGTATSPSTVCLRASNGAVLWTSTLNIESQQIMTANFTGSSGLETMGLDRVNRTNQDALFTLSSSGSKIWKEIPDTSGYGTAIKYIKDWNGGGPLCLAFKRGGSVKPEIRDGSGAIISNVSQDGNSVVADFQNKSTQEICMYSSTTAYFYSSTGSFSVPASTGVAKTQTKFLYNYSRYGSGQASGGGF